MTEGSDGKTIDGMSLTRIADLIDLLRKETFQPKPAESAPAPSDTAGREPQSQYNPVPVLFPPF